MGSAMLLDRFLNFSLQGLQNLASNYHQRRTVEWTIHHFRPSDSYSHVPCVQIQLHRCPHLSQFHAHYLRLQPHHAQRFEAVEE